MPPPCKPCPTCLKFAPMRLAPALLGWLKFAPMRLVLSLSILAPTLAFPAIHLRIAFASRVIVRAGAVEWGGGDPPPFVSAKKDTGYLYKPRSGSSLPGARCDAVALPRRIGASGRLSSPLFTGTNARLLSRPFSLFHQAFCLYKLLPHHWYITISGGGSILSTSLGNINGLSRR